MTKCPSTSQCLHHNYETLVNIHVSLTLLVACVDGDDIERWFEYMDRRREALERLGDVDDGGVQICGCWDDPVHGRHSHQRTDKKIDSLTGCWLSSAIAQRDDRKRLRVEWSLDETVASWRLWMNVWLDGERKKKKKKKRRRESGDVMWGEVMICEPQGCLVTSLALESLSLISLTPPGLLSHFKFAYPSLVWVLHVFLLEVAEYTG